jgi:crotonobetainyl-CoA:carnitine CoA-transferase CaiB-like acyl-CoA transferase
MKNTAAATGWPEKHTMTHEVPTTETALPPYRVLDLTAGGSLLGGRLLADLGADVIQIEPPAGSPSRLAPYYKNTPDPERSLFWWAYAANKRGVTLDITKPAGQDVFRLLAEKADAILESFPPGYLASLGLGYNDLTQTNPGLVLTSVTPFGQRGPKADRPASDLTVWASGAYLYACGDPDRAPTWISFPQTSLFGGAEAAIGTLAALWHRATSGEGQHVDVSLQEAAVSPNLNVLQMWDVAGVEFHRLGGALYVPATGVRQPIYFECQDGYIMILVQGGNEPFVSSSARLVDWMKDAGMAPDWLVALDWKRDYDAATMGQDVADRVEAAVTAFTKTRTKQELYLEGAIARRILMAPVASTKDIAEDVQLAARDYWRKLEHPDLGEEVVYCGPFIKMSETPVRQTRRAPRLGEHDEEIYAGELGLDAARLHELRKQGII